MPAGTWHNVINIGDEPMQLYAVYAPVNHASGKVHATAADAQRDEEPGNDEPPSWSAQPAQGPSDETRPTGEGILVASPPTSTSTQP